MRKRSLVLAVVLFLAPLFILARLWAGTPCLVSLSWDPAAHSLDGLRLYHSLVILSPLSFLVHLVSLVWWPPLPALLMVPLYAIAPAQVAPVLLSMLSLGALLAIAALFLDSLPATLVAVSTILSSWLLWKFSLFPMYELPGAALTLWAVTCYWRALEGRGDYRQVAWALLALLLTKWNFGIQLGAVLVACEAWRAPRKELWARWRVIFDPRDYRLLNLLLLALSVLIALVRVTGGGKFHGVSITEIANPLLLFSWLFALRYFLGLRKRPPALPRPLETLRRHLILPYAAWLLFPYPNRFQVLLRHLHGTGGGAQLTAARFAYYWQYVHSVYLLSTLQVATAAVGFLAVCLLAWRRRSPGAAMACAYFAFALFSTWFLSSTADDRLLLNFFPVLGVLLGWAARETKVAWLAALAAAAFPIAQRDFFRERVARFHKDGDGICFYDERVPRDLRDQVIGVADRDARAVMTVGLSSDSDLLCPLVELLFQRHHPQFASLPPPPICDYGYRRGPLDVLREGKLQAVVIFDRPLPEVPPVKSWLAEHPEIIVDKTPFSLAGTPYQGFVYRLK